MSERVQVNVSQFREHFLVLFETVGLVVFQLKFLEKGLVLGGGRNGEVAELLELGCGLDELFLDLDVVLVFEVVFGDEGVVDFLEVSHEVIEVVDLQEVLQLVEQESLVVLTHARALDLLLLLCLDPGLVDHLFHPLLHTHIPSLFQLVEEQLDVRQLLVHVLVYFLKVISLHVLQVHVQTVRFLPREHLGPAGHGNESLLCQGVTDYLADAR